mgnify:FL=1
MYDVIGGRRGPAPARTFGDEKSMCPSDQRTGGGGIGLLLSAVAGGRDVRAGAASLSDVRARFRAKVGDAGGELGGEVKGFGDDGVVGEGACVCFTITARGRRSFTKVPSSRWCEICKTGWFSRPAGNVNVPRTWSP